MEGKLYVEFIIIAIVLLYFAVGLTIFQLRRLARIERLIHKYENEHLQLAEWQTLIMDELEQRSPIDMAAHVKRLDTEIREHLSRHRFVGSYEHEPRL